jgi:hypothetical protein
MLSTSATILREPVLSYGRHGQFSRGQVGDQGHVLAVPFDHVVVGQSRVAVGCGGDAAADEKVVVCDRYLPSSLVLQAIDGLESDTVWRLNAGVYVPDVVVLLNADPPVIAERLRQRGAHSRFERQPGGSRHVSYPKPDHGDYGVMMKDGGRGCDGSRRA